MVDEIIFAPPFGIYILDHAPSRCKDANKGEEEDTENGKLLGCFRVELQDSWNWKQEDPNVEEEIGDCEAVQIWK